MPEPGSVSGLPLCSACIHSPGDLVQSQALCDSSVHVIPPAVRPLQILPRLSPRQPHTPLSTHLFREHLCLTISQTGPLLLAPRLLLPALPSRFRNLCPFSPWPRNPGAIRGSCIYLTPAPSPLASPLKYFQNSPTSPHFPCYPPGPGDRDPSPGHHNGSQLAPLLPTPGGVLSPAASARLLVTCESGHGGSSGSFPGNTSDKI